MLYFRIENYYHHDGEQFGFYKKGHTGKVGPSLWSGIQDSGPWVGTLGWDPEMEPVVGPWGETIGWDSEMGP